MHDNFMCGRGSYTYITAATTTQVFSGPGRLHSIVINKALTGTVTIIDGIAGSTANVGVITNSSGPIGTVFYDVVVGNGLRIINSGAEDITVVWAK